MEDAEVPFNMDTIPKCICMQCPVQTQSTCAKEKAEKGKEMMEKAEPGMAPKSEDVPGMYCSTGVAHCKDIDTKQMCICGSCPLWGEFKLPEKNPKGYYCRDGQSKS